MRPFYKGDGRDEKKKTAYRNCRSRYFLGCGRSLLDLKTAGRPLAAVPSELAEQVTLTPMENLPGHVVLEAYYTPLAEEADGGFLFQVSQVTPTSLERSLRSYYEQETFEAMMEPDGKFVRRIIGKDDTSYYAVVMKPFLFRHDSGYYETQDALLDWVQTALVKRSGISPLTQSETEELNRQFEAIRTEARDVYVEALSHFHYTDVEQALILLPRSLEDRIRLVDYDRQEWEMLRAYYIPDYDGEGEGLLMTVIRSTPFQLRQLSQVLDQDPGGWDYLGQSQEFLYFGPIPQADGASPGYASAKEALLSWVREDFICSRRPTLSREEFQAPVPGGWICFKRPLLLRRSRYRGLPKQTIWCSIQTAAPYLVLSPFFSMSGTLRAGPTAEGLYFP